jgi:flagellar biosynthesis/type III secretory pathway protein FliH
MSQMLKALPLSLLCFLISCADPYQDGLEAGKKMGYQEGYEVGYDEGNADGDANGYARAKAYFESAGYNEGFADGKKVGLREGYDNGYTVGKNETYKPAYDNGYKTGYGKGYDDGRHDGYKDGYEDGYDDRYDEIYKTGYDKGYKIGYDKGLDKGYDLGYDDGFDDGYDLGYDDGFEDGSLSVGKSKTLKGYANIISLAHNTVFDYSKIPAPKSTSRGLVVNGEILLSEISLTNKDTLKRRAVVEQYLVIEMASQVRSKFGLSLERSLKLAKAANHFRKEASRRALTQEDNHAYASEIIGSDFTQITKAYEKSLKGDIQAFNSVLERAAEKNGTTPENIALILAKYFM